MVNAALWEVQDSAGNGTEATAGDTHTIDFKDGINNTISEGAFITDIIVDFRRAVPENESVGADNNELQDMGISGFDITISGVTGDVDSDTTGNPINKLSKWLQDGNTATGYTKGRFGLRVDRAPQWNVVPTSALGYHIKDISISYMGENKDMARFTINLALGGDIKTAI